MNELQKEIENGESESCEFKQSCSKFIINNIYIPIISFSRNIGGSIYIGIKDDGTIIGIRQERNKINQYDRIQQIIMSSIMNNIYPKYTEDIKVKFIDIPQPVGNNIHKKFVVKIIVPKSDQIYTDKEQHGWKRIMSSCVKIPPQIETQHTSAVSELKVELDILSKIRQAENRLLIEKKIRYGITPA